MALLDDIEDFIHGDYYRNTTIPVPPKFAARSKNGLRDLNKLLKSRKGFRGESRSYAVYILCWLLRTGTQFSEDEIFSQAMELGAKCVEPLTVADVESAFINSRNRLRHSNARIAKRLEITKKERAMKLFPTPKKSPKRVGPSNAEIRQERIRQFVKGGAIVPTINEVLYHLDIAYGIEASDKTIRRDYKALGIINPHTPGGSPPTPPEL